MEIHQVEFDDHTMEYVYQEAKRLFAEEKEVKIGLCYHFETFLIEKGVNNNIDCSSVKNSYICSYRLFTTYRRMMSDDHSIFLHSQLDKKVPSYLGNMVPIGPERKDYLSWIITTYERKLNERVS